MTIYVIFFIKHFSCINSTYIIKSLHFYNGSMSSSCLITFIDVYITIISVRGMLKPATRNSNCSYYTYLFRNDALMTSWLQGLTTKTLFCLKGMYQLTTTRWKYYTVKWCPDASFLISNKVFPHCVCSCTFEIILCSCVKSCSYPTINLRIWTINNSL